MYFRLLATALLLHFSLPFAIAVGRNVIWLQIVRYDNNVTASTIVIDLQLLPLRIIQILSCNNLPRSYSHPSQVLMQEHLHARLVLLLHKILGSVVLPLVLTSLLCHRFWHFYSMIFFDSDASHHMTFDKSIITNCFPTQNSLCILLLTVLLLQ